MSEITWEMADALREVLDACEGRQAGYGGFYQSTIDAIPIAKRLADAIEAQLPVPVQTRAQRIEQERREERAADLIIQLAHLHSRAESIESELGRVDAELRQIQGLV